MSNITDLMEQALPLADRAMTYQVSTRLAELYPDMTVLECSDPFDIDGFARYGNGDARVTNRLASEEYAYWDTEENRLRRFLLTSWIEVEFNGVLFQVVWAQRLPCGTVYWVVGPESSIEDFVVAVEKFSRQRAPATHVYCGWWSDSPSFDRAVEASNWDQLVLPEAIESSIETHAIGFFSAREEFEQLGVPWKRGLLLTGPPGNGKTHLIRAVLNRLSVPRIVVKSFGDDIDDLNEAFRRVREMAPCVLVLEDLDSLIRPEMLSSVLNALDGVEPLDGVLVIATTNHPEKLDPAIRSRPSRFDRVLEFGPPEIDERILLLRKFLDRVPKEARLTASQVRRLAARTVGFSYAYVKELAVSASVVWAQERRSGAMFGIISELADELHSQMANEANRSTGSPS